MTPEEDDPDRVVKCMGRRVFEPISYFTPLYRGMGYKVQHDEMPSNEPFFHRNNVVGSAFPSMYQAVMRMGVSSQQPSNSVMGYRIEYDKMPFLSSILDAFFRVRSFSHAL